MATGIKPFNINDFNKASFMKPRDVGYQDSIDIINDELHKTRQSFVKIGWYLKHIHEAKMYEEGGYTNIYELAYDKFNISQSTATRFMKLCVEFSVGNDSPELDEKYIDFSVSQLFEMLPMKENREMVTADMTVKEIRDIKKGKESQSAKAQDSGTEQQKGDDDNVPGQTSIEKDFPEYLPDALEREEAIIDGEYLEIVETPSKAENGMETFAGHIEGKKDAEGKANPVESRQPEFPAFKNDEQRKSWLEDVEAWGLWYEDTNIQARYYKYDFPEGSRLIAVKYRYTCPPWMEREKQCKEKDGSYGDAYYHMIYSEGYKENHKYEYEKYYTHSTASISTLVEFIKEVSKGAARGQQGVKG